MTWRDLLAIPSKKPPPGVKSSVLYTPDSIAAPERQPTSESVPVWNSSSTTPSRTKCLTPASTNNDAPSTFYLPPSPRSLVIEQEREDLAATISDCDSFKNNHKTNSVGAVQGRDHNVNKESHWELPHPTRTGHTTATASNSNTPTITALKPVTTWFIDESSSPYEQPVATSPMKDSLLRAQLEVPSSADRQKARLLFATDFLEGINRLEQERKRLFETRGFHPRKKSTKSSRNIRVFVRKRPLFAKEVETGDYDVIRVETEKDTNLASVVVYNTEIQHDLRKKEVKPAIFGMFSECFDEHCNSGEVYLRGVKPLVETAKSGGMATLVTFGQSNTGKSYTMAAVECMAARDIFTGLPYNHTVKVTMVELGGKGVVDLMDENSLSPVRVIDTKTGSVRFVNALSVTVSTPEDLLEAIGKAKRQKRGQTEGGEKLKERFCRHTMCRIMVIPPPDAPACIRKGTLTLVDCVGTERRRSQHDICGSEHFSGEINASLWALRWCLQAKTTDFNRSVTDVPYSHSNLTRCLRESLEREDATFHVIATISPKATDTEDTIDTLSTISNLVGGFAKNRSDHGQSANNCPKEDLVPPKGWDRARLCNWLVKKHLIQDIAITPDAMTGRSVMRMTKAELQKTFCAKDHQKADLLYRCLRAESDRVARLTLKRQMAIERATKGD